MRVIYKETPTWVVEALERDGHKCNKCKYNGQRILVHHRDESGKSKEPNHNLDNLETLCDPCHARAHGLTNDRQDVIELRQMGFSYGEIGKKLRLSRQRIHQIYSKAVKDSKG